MNLTSKTGLANIFRTSVFSIVSSYRMPSNGHQPWSNRPQMKATSSEIEVDLTTDWVSNAVDWTSTVFDGCQIRLRFEVETDSDRGRLNDQTKSNRGRKSVQIRHTHGSIEVFPWSK